MTSSIQLFEEVKQGKNNTLANDNILIIEHNLCLSNLLHSSFVEQGYSVNQVSYDGQLTIAMKDFIVSNPEQLVILSINCSTMTELSIVHDIRQVFNGPLIIISSQQSEVEEVEVFNLGADEYIVQPISRKVLSVRTAALFRRYKQRIKQAELASLSVGELCLEPKAQKCFVNKKTVKLTGFEFNLLKFLMENEGRILSRDQLYSTLLGRVYNGVERTLDVRMSQLREKLLSVGMAKIQIETIWGQGYMLTT